MAQGFTRTTIGGTLLVTGSTYFITTSYALSSSWSTPMGRVVGLCAAYTPSSIGADAAEIPIPYSPIDGITPLSWSVKRINIRTQTSESISSSFTIQKSINGGIFTPISLETLNLSGSLYEATTGSLGFINSGEKIRFYTNILGTSTNWTITVEINNL